MVISRQSPSLQNITPGFLETMEPKAPLALSNDLEILGLIIQDLPATNQYLKNWKFGFDIVLANSETNDSFHRLSYKKLFPFWAILLGCPSLSTIPTVESIESTALSWENKKAIWFHLETTSWDVIIVEQAPG